MSAVHDDAQALEGESPRKRGLGKLDITPQGVIDAHRLPDLARRWPYLLDLAAEDEVLDPRFDRVVQLVAVRPKEFDAIVIIRIMGRGDDNAGVSPQAAGDVGHARSGQRPDKQHVHPD